MKLEIALPKNELGLIEAALGPSTDLFIVGGAVRDALSGFPAKDIDLATSLSVDSIVSKLEQSGIKVILTGAKKGTITAIVNALSFEITTFRLGTSIEEDLSARDFTINAMAVTLSGELVDPHGGFEDLRLGVVRAVGNPADRFQEDSVRILRLFRFASRGLKLHAATLHAANTLAPTLSSAPVERVKDELTKMVGSVHASHAFRLMSQGKVLQQVLPELAACVGFEQNLFHQLDVFEHILAVMDAIPVTNHVARWAALFHDIGKPESLTVEDLGKRRFLGHEESSTRIALEVMERLKFSADETRNISLLVAEHMRSLDGGPRSVRRIKRDLGEQFPNWLILKKADLFGRRSFLDEDLLRQWTSFLSVVEQVSIEQPTASVNNLAIGGRDILALGVKQGPLVGEVLNSLHELVLDDPSINCKERLVQEAVRLIEAKANAKSGGSCDRDPS